MEEIRGKVAVVTGAASGIGRGITGALVAEGCSVALLDIEREAVEDACAALREAGAPVQCWTCDVSRRDRVPGVAAAVREHFGRVDILCNNAGVTVSAPVVESTADDWEWVLGVNLHGVLNGMRVYVPMMREHGEGGHIVNIASIYGVVTDARRAVYAASKHAVVALSEVAREELAAEGIGVTAVCPDGVRTQILKARRNRPPALADTRDRLIKHGEEAEQNLAVKGIDADTVGKRVVRAIRANEAYVFTHAGSRERILERTRRMIDAFDGTEAG